MNGPAIGPASPWIEAIGWMLLHSLWQGAGVALALAVALRALRRAPSRTRYIAGCAAMILLVTLPVATLLRSNVPPPWSSIHRDTASGPAIVTPIRLDGASPPRVSALRAADRLEPMLPAIVMLWMSGVAVFSLRLLGGWIQAGRWVRQRTRPLADPWTARVERLKERLGVRRAVALLESARIEVPMVVGWLRPAILVPVAALSGLSVPELEAILAHELAHIRRHDYLINLIQCVIEVLLFYHPATWWTSRAIRREREVCCDDLAVAISRDRVTYARALAAMEGLRVPAFSPSTAASGGPLLVRVRRVLNPQEESMNPVRILAGLAVILAAAPLWLARADDDQPPPLEGAPSLTQPFPNRSFADIVTSVDEHMAGRFPIGPGSQPAKLTRAWDSQGARTEMQAWKDLDNGTIAFLRVDSTQRDAGTRAPAEARPGSQAVPVVDGTTTTSPDSPAACLDPPTETEVLAQISRPNGGHTTFYKSQRENVRVVVEKIGSKVDPVKVYPLAGPCQLVHCHYKCTVTFDERSWSDDPIPFKHVDHKVEVVYINKDHLRRAGLPQASTSDPVDDRLDRLSREIRQLKLARRRNRGEQERILDRLIEELEGLKRELRDDSKDPGAAPPPKIR